MAELNLTAAFKAMFEEAYRLAHAGDFDEADTLCFRLLREPNLPILYRAGCNLILSCGEDKPVEFAEEAVMWYQEMYDHLRDDPTDGPHHKALLKQAQDAVIRAKKRVAGTTEANDDADGEAQNISMSDYIGGDDEEGGTSEADDDADGEAENISMSDYIGGDDEEGLAAGTDQGDFDNGQDFDSQKTAVQPGAELPQSSPADTAVASSQIGPTGGALGKSKDTDSFD